MDWFILMSNLFFLIDSLMNQKGSSHGVPREDYSSGS